jgi:predicted dehydrogenase
MMLHSLTHEVEIALDRARRFLIDQVSDDRPAWGPQPQGDLDPWPRAQILYALPRDGHVDILLRGLSWLAEKQNADGSWTSHNYGKAPDTSATACCTIALLHHFGPGSVAAERGLQWLCANYHGGWANMPDRGEPVHYYDTAYALRALVRGSRRASEEQKTSAGFPEGQRVLALRAQQAKSHLLAVRVARAGWGFRPGEAPDPSFTSYVLHGLLDMQRLSQVPLPRQVLAEALNWLAARQNADRTWTNWEGISTSPEATAYAVYVLLSAGASPAHPRIIGAINWLIGTQLENGGWGLQGEPGDPSVNWLANIVVVALTAFLLASRHAGQRETLFDANAPLSFTAEGLTFPNLDHAEGPTPFFAAEFPPLRRGRLLPAGSDADLSLLYSSPLKMSYNQVPYTRQLDHTMYKALDRYVAQKLPDGEIERALHSGQTIEVHGIYPDHFPLVAGQLQLDGVEEIRFRHKEPADSFNSKRPAFFRASRGRGQRVLVIAVIPGRDYVLHYASLVRHLALQRYTMNAAQRIAIYRYPLAEEHLADWTRLDATLVRPGDRVLLGYVSAVREHLEADGQFRFLGRHENEYYGSYRFAAPNGSTLNLLGVKYCYWGSISETLCASLCEIGASEVLYVAKLGALTGPQDLYTRIFCPARYYLLYHDRIADAVTALPNGVLRCFPERTTGAHVSVPTVLEEDYRQRRVATDLGATSLDNEIAQMARGIARFNRGRGEGEQVAFSAIHFATDYVRSPEDQVVATDHDLSRMRRPDALAKKKRILNRICTELLLPYLLGASEERHAPARSAPVAAVPVLPEKVAVPPVSEPAPRNGAVSSTGMLRVGVIGIGNHASENLLPTIALLPGMRIAGLSSRSPANLHKAAEQYGVPYQTTNWRELVDPRRVDAVVVAATPQVHEQVLRLALERHIHVFLEKPPAVDLAGLTELTDLTRKQPEVVTFVDYNFRFAAGYQKLREVVAEGGKVECIKVRFLTNKPREPLWGSSSVLHSYLYAVAIHVLDLVLHELGPVAAVSARARRFDQRLLALSVQLTGADGRLALLDLGNYSNRFEARTEVVTTTGLTGVLDDLRRLQVYGGGSFRDERDRFGGKEVGEYVLPFLRGGFGVGGYEQALSSFRTAITHKQSSPAPLADSVAIYRVLEEVLQQVGE